MQSTRPVSAVFTPLLIFLVVSKCSALEEIVGTIPKSGKPLGSDSGATVGKGHDSESVEDSVLHLLVAALSPFKTPHEKDATLEDKLSKPVPAVELDKLKASAKSAGLSEQKANRVRRGADLLDLDLSDIAVLRREFQDPGTTAEYGDSIRKVMEKRCIEEEYRRSAAPAQGGATTIPADIYQRLRTAAKLSGLKDNEVEAFIKVLQATKVTQQQLTQLEDAIVHHGPGPVDMKKLMAQLAVLRKARNAAEEQDDTGYDWNNQKQGSDWLFKPEKLPPQAQFQYAV